MRIIAGERKGMTLYSIEGRDTRPTTDRIKETLFNILAAEVPGSVFLDLYAGTGQIALEALSRGAEKAVLVENSRKAVPCIRQNIEKTRYTDKAELLERDVFAALSYLNGRSFDIVFCDPPYQSGVEEKLLLALSSWNIVNEDGLVIVEADLHTAFDFAETAGFAVAREKIYKTNKHVFLRRL